MPESDKEQPRNGSPATGDAGALQRYLSDIRPEGGPPVVSKPLRCRFCGYPILDARRSFRGFCNSRCRWRYFQATNPRVKLDDPDMLPEERRAIEAYLDRKHGIVRGNIEDT